MRQGSKVNGLRIGRKRIGAYRRKGNQEAEDREGTERRMQE